MYVFRNFKQELYESLKNIKVFETKQDFYEYVLSFAKENFNYLKNAKLENIQLTDADGFFGFGFGKNSLYVVVDNKTIGICKHYTNIEEYEEERAFYCKPYRKKPDGLISLDRLKHMQ